MAFREGGRRDSELHGRFAVQTMSSDILSQNRNDVQKIAELSNVLRLIGGSRTTEVVGGGAASAKIFSHTQSRG